MSIMASAQRRRGEKYYHVKDICLALAGSNRYCTRKHTHRTNDIPFAPNCQHERTERRNADALNELRIHAKSNLQGIIAARRQVSSGDGSLTIFRPQFFLLLYLSHDLEEFQPTRKISTRKRLFAKDVQSP